MTHRLGVKMYDSGDSETFFAEGRLFEPVIPVIGFDVRLTRRRSPL